MSTPESPAPAGGARHRLADPEAGARLLDRAPPPGYRAEWTAHLAKPPKVAETTTAAAMVFRVGEEWLALPADWVGEITPARAVHSLPHKRGGVLEGIANVRGELLLCFSLGRVLGIETAAGAEAARRLIVAGNGARRVVFRADEIFGVLRYDEARRLPSPGKPSLVPHLLEWNGRTLGLIDAEHLWKAFEGGLA